MRPVIWPRTWRGKLARQMAARKVITPAQAMRAAIMLTVSKIRPNGLTGAMAISSKKAPVRALRADTQAVLSRPSAKPETVNDTRLAKAGAPATRATATLTHSGSAASAKRVLTTTATKPPSSAPRATAIEALALISRGSSVRAINGRRAADGGGEDGVGEDRFDMMNLFYAQPRLCQNIHRFSALIRGLFYAHHRDCQCQGRQR